MITTYLIEDNKDVFNYYKRLYSAKEDLKSLNDLNYRILCLKGGYFGEGFHQYEVRYINNKFIRKVL